MNYNNDTSMYIATAAFGGDTNNPSNDINNNTSNQPLSSLETDPLLAATGLPLTTTTSQTLVAPPPVAEAASLPASLPIDNVPVFIMLPLDTVNADGVFKYAASRWFTAALQQLQESGIHGVAVDVWWAGVERRPRRYDWSGYRQLFDLISSLGLKLQVVMAFHACGGNVGDNAEVPLPGWVVAAGERDPDIFFTDRPRESTPGQRNRECISLFAAEEPGLLKGRSPMQCYVDFMRAFREEFKTELGCLIEEIVVGAGPCGELRFPSYPEPNGWRFPGIGEFQCYDRRALASLARAAVAVGHPEWGNAGPHDAGTYNSGPEETGFFRGWGGRWDTEYGRFFLSWYSGALLEHGERMLAAAASVFNVVSTTNSGGTGNGVGSGNIPTISSGGNMTTNAAANAINTTINTNTMNNTNKNMSILKEREDSGVLDTPVSIGDDSSDPGWNGNVPWRQGSGASIATSQRGASVGSLEGLGGGGNGGNASGLPPLATTTPTPSGGGSGGTGSGSIPETSPKSAAAGASAVPPSPLQTASSLPSPVQPPQQQPPSSLTIPQSPSNGGSGSAPPSLSGAPVPNTTSGFGSGSGLGTAAAAGGGGNGGVTRPSSFASFRSSSISENLNALEDWTWPSPSGPPVGITLKVAGVHWWYRTRSHAAELTAGYYNCDGSSGYDAIVGLCARHGASLTLTCVEMCDSQHPPEALCGPEGLLRQVREAAAAVGVHVGGENALPCFMPNVIDEVALQRVVYNTQPWGTQLQQGGSGDAGSGGGMNGPYGINMNGGGGGGGSTQDMMYNSPNTVQPQMPQSFSSPGFDTAMPSASSAPQFSGGGGGGGGGGEVGAVSVLSADARLPPMRNFTFLRLTPEMMSPSYFDKWQRFMLLMAHNAQRYKSSPRWRQNLGFSSSQ